MKFLSLIALLSSTVVHANCPIPTQGELSLVFLGNSITKHPPAPEIGWDSDWGMAASSKDLDFVSRVRDHYAGSFSRVSVARVSIVGFEKGLETGSSITEKVMAYRPDIIVVQGGDNIDKSPAGLDRFINQYSALMGGFGAKRSDACFRIACVGPWFSAGTDTAQMKACQAIGAPFISLRSAYADPTMNAKESLPNASSGVRAHPNDTGMLFIARAILQALGRN